MKRLIKNLIVFIMAMPVMCLSSCIYENFDSNQTVEQTPDDLIWLHINVGSVNATASGSDFSNSEPIYSLRVIILDEDGVVEYNQKENFSSPVSYYFFNALVKAGKKTFYFIANADNVTIFQSGTASTEKDIFNAFPVGATGFDSAVNSLYFENSYYDTPSNPIPLSSCYEITTEPGKQDLTFYLVRAATKYTVHFENSRSDPVYLNDLYISQLMDKMYLMPHVGNDQQTIDGKFWIEWLRDVADKSHLESSNQGDANFNDIYGWLTDYSVPSLAEPFDFYLLKDANLEVPGLQTSAGEAKPQPGTKDIGPFYSTEGKNLLPNNTSGLQQYTVNIKLTYNKENNIFSDYRILPNLSALFRNTHVIINISLDESYMHVYGEIHGWDEYTIYGDVTEEK